MSTQTPTERPAIPASALLPRRHVLDLDDFSLDEINAVLDAAEAMHEVLGRSIKKVPSLRGKVIVTLFYEASTRTRVSFEQAGKILSADVINVSASGSSAEKGESLLNTILTLQAMRADLLIIRHQHSGAPYFVARNLAHTGVINAGDGRHAHPTQGLLDLFTIRRHLGSLEERKIVIVGDVLHSRVARSDILGLAVMGAHVVLSGPPTLMPVNYAQGEPSPLKVEDSRPVGGEERERRQTKSPSPLFEEGVPLVTYEPNLDAAVEDADVVMALRLQHERQDGGMLPSLREYTRRWQITEERMRRAHPSALLMHPGPLNEGIEISSSLAHSEVAQIEEQVTNGVAVRMALLYQLLTGQEEA